MKCVGLRPLKSRTTDGKTGSKLMTPLKIKKVTTSLVPIVVKTMRPKLHIPASPPHLDIKPIPDFDDIINSDDDESNKVWFVYLFSFVV